ncbi:class I tRNA ligase family protein [Chromobacterium sp. Beijing]|uniref:class I tRNA ligase family protein n=1 Tax=Chromobacterium sp. Beijing TaxID=2735795 RepID=UPI00351CBD14
MSKSRGTFIQAKSYLDCGLNPEWMRYYIAAKTERPHRRHRSEPERLRRAGEFRSGGQVRQHRQPLRRLHRQAF